MDRMSRGHRITYQLIFAGLMVAGLTMIVTAFQQPEFAWDIKQMGHLGTRSAVLILGAGLACIIAAILLQFRKL